MTLTFLFSFIAYTINAAWQLHANNDLGILDKGKFADLLILGKNPYSYADRPEDLGKIPVVGTFVGGQPNDGLLKFVKKTDVTEKFYILEHIEICPV
jgi:predicted amidohydrolase YtcJ